MVKKIRMKKICLLICLLMAAYFVHAQQRFFYIESNPITDSSIREELLNATQYITRTPLSSDYIIKSDVGLQKGSNTLSLKIVLEDSLTFKTIYQVTEEHMYHNLNKDESGIFRTTIRYFIIRNMNQMILCAKADYRDLHMKWLKSRKDKT